MTTTTQVYEVIKARLEANKPVELTAYRWQNANEDSEGELDLPDVSAPFAWVELAVQRGELVSFGSGRGGNRYRYPAEILGYIFVPKGEGVARSTDLAEQLAVLFRSYRDENISCFDATAMPGGDGAVLKPPGLSSEVGNYFWASVEVSLFYDQIG